MKKLLTILIIILASFAVNAQKEFTSKKEALEFLQKTLSTNFVKTAVIGKYDGKKFNKYNYYFDYELTDEFLKIYCKVGDDPDDFFQKNHTWTLMNFKDIIKVEAIQESKNYKKITGVLFTSQITNLQGGRFTDGYGKSALNSTNRNSTAYGSFPFNNASDIEIIRSIIKAINIIVKENLEEEKIAKEKSERAAIMNDEQTLNTISLQQYEVFTTDSTKVNLQDYIAKSRKYKENPTLIVIYSNEYCRPCLIKIDSLLNNNQSLQYNIVLINMDFSSDFTKLKKKIADHSPDYMKSVLLVFDRTDAMQAVHKSSAPMFLWLDKKMNIVGSQRGYKINTSTINSILMEIESKP
jgi:hypothetical protein